MSQPPSSQPFPNHGGNSDSLDAEIMYIDGPTDLPLGEPDPALRKILAEERALILKWHPEWLQGSKGGQVRRQPFPNHGSNSDSLDAEIMYTDGPTDLPLGEPDPALRKILAEERALILKWRPEWLQMGKKENKPDNPE